MSSLLNPLELCFFVFVFFLNLTKSTNQSLRPLSSDCTQCNCIFSPHFHFPSLICMYFAVVVLICVVLCYRRSEVPGGGPGLEGIRGGGEPMPISGSCVNRKPCRRRRCQWQRTYLTGVWTPQQNIQMQQVSWQQQGEGTAWPDETGCTIRWMSDWGGGRLKLHWAILFIFYFFAGVCSVLKRFNPSKASPLLMSCWQFTDWQHWLQLPACVCKNVCTS